MEKNKIDELSRLLEQLKSGEITQEEFEASKNNLLNPSIDSSPENEIIYPNNNNLGILGGNSAAPLDMNNLSAMLENRANEERKSKQKPEPEELNLPEFSNSVSPKNIWQAGKFAKSIYWNIVFLIFVGVIYTIIQSFPQLFVELNGRKPEDYTPRDINAIIEFQKVLNNIDSLIQFIVYTIILSNLKGIADKLMKSSLPKKK